MFQRKINKTLEEWKLSKTHKPILLRGARQIGKSYLMTEFAKSFDSSANINLEFDKDLHQYFDSLDPELILSRIFLLKGIDLKQTGTNLLILDEIQECLSAIVALRYFHERMPNLFVIGAGSLLEFVLNKNSIDVPVGRIHYLFMEPMNFSEYLGAIREKPLIDYISALNLKTKPDEVVHKKLLEEFKNYLLLGGMPGVIAAYIENDKSFAKAFIEQKSIIETYRDDLKKYGTNSEYKYLRKTFDTVASMLGRKYIYSRVDPDSNHKNIKYAYEILTQVGLSKKIKNTSPHSMPLEVLADDNHFKPLFLDCGLMQNILGLSHEHILQEDFHSTAAGAIAEQFVGQELIANMDPYRSHDLYYWHKNKSEAEIDYLISVNGKAIPIEVKSSGSRAMKSMGVFIDEFNSAFGIKISTKPLALRGKILDLPFYAVSEIERISGEV